LKFQLLIEEKKGRILEVATSAEQEHDLCLARRYAHHLPVASVCAVDLGYVGFVVEGCSMLCGYAVQKAAGSRPRAGANGVQSAVCQGSGQGGASDSLTENFSDSEGRLPRTATTVWATLTVDRHSC
jgi:hypothetical protein